MKSVPRSSKRQDPSRECGLEPLTRTFFNMNYDTLKQYGIETLGTEDKFNEWMHTYCSVLDRKPLSLTFTTNGMKKVLKELKRINRNGTPHQTA